MSALQHVASAIVLSGPQAPLVPNYRAANCKLLSHSDVGLYEFQLSGGGLAANECIDEVTVRGGTLNVDAHIEHVSDTVKRVRTNVAGAASDGIAFSVSFARIPAGVNITGSPSDPGNTVGALTMVAGQAASSGVDQFDLISATVGPAGSGANYITTGISDEVVINNALSAISAIGGGVVHLMPGLYKILSPIVMQQGVTLQGSGKATQVAADVGYPNTYRWMVIAAGAAMTGNSITLTANASLGAQSLSVVTGTEVAALKKGDYLFLRSETQHDPELPTIRKLGEFVRVLSADNTAGTIQLYNVIRDTYLTSATAVAFRVSFLERAALRDIEFFQLDAYATRTFNASVIRLTLTKDFTCDGLSIHDNDGPGIVISSSIGAKVNRCSLRDLTNVSPAFGYGCLIGVGSENVVISNNTFDTIRHAVDCGPHASDPAIVSGYGIARGVVVSGNTAMRALAAAFTMHSDGENWLFTGNTASDCIGHGFYMRAKGAAILGNTVVNCTAGIEIGDTTYNGSGGSAEASTAIGNFIRFLKVFSSTAAYAAANVGQTASTGEGIIVGLTDGSTIQGNTIEYTDRAGIRLTRGARNNIIKNNSIVNANLLAATDPTATGTSAIDIEAGYRSLISSQAVSGGIATVTTGATIDTSMVGRSIVINDTAHPVNNGTFVVLTVPSTTTFTYANASAVASTSTVQFGVEGATDNFIEGNVARNYKPFFDGTGASGVGSMQYFINDLAIATNYAANSPVPTSYRNIIKNNTAIGMAVAFSRVVVGNVAYGNDNGTPQSSTQITVGPAGSDAAFVANGATDDVVINSAIAAAVSAGVSLVKLLPGTYYISAPVTLTDGITLQGSGRHVTKLLIATAFSNSNYYVLGTLGQETSATSGTTAGVVVPLLNDACMGNPTIAFTPSSETAAIVVGDFLMVQSSANWEPTNVAGNGRLCGEYVEVLALGNNPGATTLVGVFSAASTSLTVSDASSFTAALPFTIRVEGETLNVTAITGNVFTVTRAVASQNGPAFATLAVAHGITGALSGAHTATQTTLSTNVVTGWPLVPFRAIVESETVFVTGVTQGVLTVVRGYDGTTAATHADTTPINTLLPVNAGWIETSSYMRDNYYVTDSASLVRVTFVQNIEISDLQISQQAARGTRTGNPPGMIGLIRARRAILRNLYLHDNDGPAVTIYHSLDIGMQQCSVERLVSDPTNARYGYGCLIGGASERVVVSTNRFGQVRHAVDSGLSKAPSGNATNSHGVPRGVLVEGNVATNTLNASFSTHNDADGWTFSANSASHSNDAAFNMRARGCHILGNSIEWCGQGIIIGNPIGVGQEGGSGAGSHVVGNSIRYMKALPSTGSLGTGIQTTVTDHVHIKNNSISECDRAGIQVKTGTVGCVFSNNTITDCNLTNGNGSVSDGISIDAGRTGATSSLVLSGTTVTLTQASLAADPSYVGRNITVSGAATPGNNGTFPITAIVGTTGVTYTNAAGATDANNGSITYVLESSTDNIFEYNTVRNSPVSKYLRSAQGLTQSLVRDYGIAGQNERNVYRFNKAVNLSTGVSVNPIRTGGASFIAEQNEDANGTIWSGTDKTTIRRFKSSTVYIDGATPATNTLFTFTAVALKADTLKGSLVAVDSTGTQRLFYSVNGSFGNPAGTALQNNATPVVEDYETTTSATVTVDAAGTQGRVRVLGIANTTLRWEYDLTLTEVAA